MSKKKQNHKATMNNSQEKTKADAPAESVVEEILDPTAQGEGEASPPDEVEDNVAAQNLGDEPAVDATPEEQPATPAPVAQTSAVSVDMVDPRFRSDFALLTEQFEQYCKTLARSNPVDNDAGAQAQVRLWRMIESVLRKEGEAFTVLFGHMLSLFARERRGVLDERVRYRFFGSIAIGADEVRNFEGILTGLMTLCNPTDRVLRSKQVDLARVFKNYPDKAAEARVIDYFSV